jgi:hypothetical protein
MPFVVSTGGSRTARELIRDTATHLGELKLARATSNGLATTIVDSSLRKHLPRNIPDFNAWVYAVEGQAVNTGSEQRAASWAADSATMTLYLPGFPAETRVGDAFEVHTRTERGLKLDALNEAIGLLGAWWTRHTVDESLTTAPDKWDYDLPASMIGPVISKVELQVSTEGRPYMDATGLDWSIRRSVGDDGAEVFKLQFGQAPPPGVKIRLHADVDYAGLISDDDVLPLPLSHWGRQAELWVIHYAVAAVLEIEGRKSPGTQSSRYTADADKLTKELETLQRWAPTRSPNRIVVPGRGTSQAASGAGTIYLGVLA